MVKRPPPSAHADSAPAWSVKPYVCLGKVEEEVDRGDIREIVEIGRAFWKVVLTCGFLRQDGETRSE